MDGREFGRVGVEYESLKNALRIVSREWPPVRDDGVDASRPLCTQERFLDVVCGLTSRGDQLVAGLTAKQRGLCESQTRRRLEAGESGRQPACRVEQRSGLVAPAERERFGFGQGREPSAMLAPSVV